MGLLFEKSEKKVAHTMTVVEMTRKYELEIANLEEENQRLSEKVEKLDDFKAKINTRMHNLKNSVAKHPDKLKEHELDTFKWLWEEVK